MRKILFSGVVFGLFSSCLPSAAYAQKHHAFDARVTQKDNGWIVFQVRPHVSDGLAEDTGRYGVYGVLICYTYNGKKKAARQDMTSELVDDGKYEYTLSYSATGRVTNLSYEFFDATKPSSTYPSKGSCY